MSAPKFTPGPWFASGVRATIDRQRWLRVLRETTEQELAFIPYGDRTQEEHVQTTADARLISAAPDLFEALRSMISEVPEDGVVVIYSERGFQQKTVDRDVVRKARAALAKALGEPR